VVDLDAALGEQFLDVAVGQPKRRYQWTARMMTSGGKRKPAKADRLAGAGRGRRDLMPSVLPLERGHSECNSGSGAVAKETGATVRPAGDLPRLQADQQRTAPTLTGCREQRTALT
jgi:hypothetical protein